MERFNLVQMNKYLLQVYQLLQKRLIIFYIFLDNFFIVIREQPEKGPNVWQRLMTFASGTFVRKAGVESSLKWCHN